MSARAPGPAPKLPNLGPASWAMLAGAGITDETALRKTGAVAAFIAVQRAGAAPSLNLLWVLEGALTNRPWQEVARSERLRLLMALDDAQNPSACP